MGIEESDLARQPAISDMLKNILGSPYKAIDFLRFSSAEASVAVLEVFDAVPVGDKKYISMEAICLKADVEPARLLGEVMVMMRDVKSKESAMIAMNAHPDIVRTTVECAKLTGGDKDRRMLHEASGFLPTPKNGGINLNLGFQLPSGPPSRAPGLPEPDDDDEPKGSDEPLGIFTHVTPQLDAWGAERRALLESGK